MVQTQQLCMLLFPFVLFSVTCDAFAGARIDLARKVAAASSPAGANVTAPVHASFSEYLLEVSIGTPPVSYNGIADTGSDLIWLACQPCEYCTNQFTPEYDPTESSTYSAIPCDSPMCDALREDYIQASCSKGNGCFYYEGYGGNNSSEWTTGTLGIETFTFGSSTPVVLPSISFGCSNDSNGVYSNASGIVGLGRGKLSLVSQLGAKKFSYCLTSYSDTRSTSPLFLGSWANLSGSSSVKSTRFVANPSNSVTYYYLSLEGISVGATPLPIPPTVFELNPVDGTGGTIIDSGTTLTYIPDEAHRLVKQAIESQVKLPKVDLTKTGLQYDLCYIRPFRSSPPQMPNITFHFDGADMELLAENYMIPQTPGLWCLTILGTNGPAIFGNVAQQNMHMLYDLENEVLSFEPAQCNKL